MFIASWYIAQYTGGSCAKAANRVIWEKKWFAILPFKDVTTNRPVNKYDDDDDVGEAVKTYIQTEP